MLKRTYLTVLSNDLIGFDQAPISSALCGRTADGPIETIDDNKSQPLFIIRNDAGSGYNHG